MRAWRAANPGKIKAQNAAYHVANREKRNARAVVYRAANREKLGPETVKTIESNLRIIDLATAQARQALAADPANPYLKEYLSKTMKKKVELLKQATVFATAQ